MSEKIDLFEKRMDETDRRIVRTNEQMFDIASRPPEPDDTIRSVSPKSLADRGKKVAEEMDAPLIVDDLVESIYAETQNMSPYDVQEMCYAFVETWTPPENVANLIKNCAYQNGISWEKTVAVIAIQLRDRILERQNKAEQQPVA